MLSILCMFTTRKIKEIFYFLTILSKNLESESMTKSTDSDAESQKTTDQDMIKIQNTALLKDWRTLHKT
jgi:hypothetical protein